MTSTLKRMLLLLGVIPIIFSSCLVSESRIEIGKNGVDLEYHYEINSDLLNFARFDENPQQMALLIDETEFQRLSNQHNGISLRSYKSRTISDANTEIIEVALHLETVSDLQYFYNDENNEFSTTDNSLKLPLVHGIAGDLLEEQRDILSEEENLLTFTFTFVLPSAEVQYSFDGQPPSTVVPVDTRGGKSVIHFEYDEDDLINFDGMTFIELTW